MRIYNTLTKKEEEFKPIKNGVVGMYTCGPTVYDYPHIGNYRAYITADILKRYLSYSGYEINHVMNITDVDDKTIRDSIQTGKNLRAFTDFYIEGFYSDLKKLHILPATTYPRATDHIDEMVNLVKKLLEKNFAYTSDDGSIYFNVRAWNDYGHLSGIDLKNLKNEASGRITKDEYDKENAQDFALWKNWTPEDSDVFWETELGKGRPGWHIECSGMATKYLGSHFDIHTGGIDLVFPHHENEIAQSECATGEQFVNYWVHNEWLLVDGKKMSKSLKNFVRLAGIEEQNLSPLSYRYFTYTAHYRTLSNFNWETLLGADTALKRLYNLFLELGEETGAVDESYKTRFVESLDNDLNTPIALALLWELIKDENVSPSNRKATLLDFDRVFGFGLSDLKEIDIPENIQEIIDEREQARKDKDWKKSDELRDKLERLGYGIKDTSEGVKIVKL